MWTPNHVESILLTPEIHISDPSVEWPRIELGPTGMASEHQTDHAIGRAACAVSIVYMPPTRGPSVLAERLLDDRMSNYKSI